MAFNPLLPLFTVGDKLGIPADVVAVIVCVSVDLPFAQGRFCAAEGLDKVIPVSAFRNDDFGKDYGVVITDGPLAGLFSRAIVLIDESGQVVYTEHVSELGDEPNYDAVLGVL